MNESSRRRKFRVRSRAVLVGAILAVLSSAIDGGAAAASTPAGPARPGAKKDARTAAPATPAIGPFSLASRDGQSRLDLGLTVQLRFQLDSKDQGDEEAAELSHLVELRRIRPTLSGTLLSRDLSFYLHMSTAPGSIELMDYYLDYSFAPAFRARLGQWKIPFTRYRIQSHKNLTFPDWSITTRYFGAERQIGIAAHNGYEKPPRWQYEIGLFSGVNARASHATALAKTYGEKMGNPSELADPAPRAELHPEIAAHLAYNHGPIDVSTDTDFDGGPPRISANLSVSWDLAPQRESDLSLRLAPEILLKMYGFSFSGIYYIAYARTGDGLFNQHLAFSGGLVQASYLVRNRVEVAARYSVVSTDSLLREAAQRRARSLIAAAPDEAAASQLSAQYRQAGSLEMEQEATLGLNVYLIGRALKWQNDLSWIGRRLSDGQRDDIRFRTQVGLSF